MHFVQRHDVDADQRQEGSAENRACRGGGSGVRPSFRAERQALFDIDYARYLAMQLAHDPSLMMSASSRWLHAN
jgi:hypothetical protein